MGKRRLAGKKAPSEKKQKRPGWIPWAVAGAVLLLIGGGLAYYLLQRGESVARTGSAAPDFTLRLFDGKSVALTDFKGKVVLVNFWGST